MNVKRGLLRGTVLTFENALALLVVKDGADVYSRYLAMQLRMVENKFPQFVAIGPARTHSGNPKDVSPFFGAIASRDGIAAAEEVAVFGMRGAQ